MTKTTIYRIGSLKGTDAKIYTNKSFTWSDEDIDMLGMKISNAEVQNCKQYDVCLDKIQKVAETWYNRHLTLVGKALVINTLMGSLLVYKMSTLPRMRIDQHHRFDKIINTFFWKGGRVKIPLRLLRLHKEDGGIKLVDLKAKYTAMQMVWVDNIVKNPSFAYAYNMLSGEIKELIWHVNLKHTHVNSVVPFRSHWSEVLVEWTKLHFNEKPSEDDIIWFNSLITSQGIPNIICKGILGLA